MTEKIVARIVVIKDSNGVASKLDKNGIDSMELIGVLFDLILQIRENSESMRTSKEVKE